jgi:hypothetical protein
MRWAGIFGLFLALAGAVWQTVSSAQEQVRPQIQTQTETVSRESGQQEEAEAPATQSAPAAGAQLPSEQELAARILELRRRRSDLVGKYNATYTLSEKSRLEAELRRTDELIDRALGEQALRAEREQALASGKPAPPELGSAERSAEIAARLAEFQRKRRELVDKYNTTYSLREKNALNSEISRVEELVRNTEAELALSRQAADAKPQ